MTLRTLLSEITAVIFIGVVMVLAGRWLDWTHDWTWGYVFGFFCARIVFPLGEWLATWHLYPERLKH